MGYSYWLVDHRRFESFHLGKHFWQWPTDRKDCFDSKEKLLEAIVETMAQWGDGTHGFKNLAQGALLWRNRIWRWKGETPADKIELLGEGPYYDLDKIPPETGDIWTDPT